MKAVYPLPDEHKNDPSEQERLLALAVYDCFTKASGMTPRWGILTGVRPAKLFARLSAEQGVKAAEDWFRKGLRVSSEKIALCRETTRRQNAVTALSKPASFSLYLSIPFCPTRCAYCSFVSHSIDRAKALIPPYVAQLVREIEETAAIASRLHLRLETVYIGGGTPTVLSAEQLRDVMEAVAKHFDFKNAREYTVEAGRPDTVTEEKLRVIKALGATRISINPQTMNDEVLKNIGRRHTAEQTVDAFHLARACGFSHINTDLIAGLPGDTVAGFRHTMEQVLALSPESVTVHTLAMKRASALSQSRRFPEAEAGERAADMVEFARDTLAQNGYFPYYLYRQSKTVGNLENVGYAKEGFAGYYNVYTMEETHSILACGASAVTKLRQPGGDHIERIFNFKYPYEYLDRYQELQTRKEGILRFYEQYASLY